MTDTERLLTSLCDRIFERDIEFRFGLLVAADVLDEAGRSREAAELRLAATVSPDAFDMAFGDWDRWSWWMAMACLFGERIAYRIVGHELSQE